MRNEREALKVFAVIPVTVIICLLIKMMVRRFVVVNTSIKLCNMFWLNYSEHICEYLDIQYGVAMIGRVLVLVYMLTALLVNLICKKRINKAMGILALTYISIILLVNNMMRPVDNSVLISFIAQIFVISMVYMNEAACKFLNRKEVQFLLALYIGGGLGNIIEMNTIGWVTDYLYFLPAYGFKASSNLEDWICWCVPVVVSIMVIKEILTWVYSNYKIYRLSRV